MVTAILLMRMLQANMKKLIILIMLSIIFIAGCKSQSSETTTSVATSVISNDLEDCPKEFLRKQVNPDGSIEEYCLSPDYFNLKPCNNNNDCTSAEYCSAGYCRTLE